MVIHSQGVCCGASSFALISQTLYCIHHGLNVGVRVFYTRSNGMRVPATVVGFAPDGLLHLEYFQDAVKVVNRQCKVESISFAIPSADSPPPSTRSPSPPPDDRGRSPSKSATPSPRVFLV